MVWQSRRAGWVILVATIPSVVTFLALEVYLRNWTKGSCSLLSDDDDDRLGEGENTKSDEVDDLPARLARVYLMCKKYAGLQCNDTIGQNTRRDYLHCGRGQASFYLVQNRRFGFCSIPKTASSSLKALILKAEHFKDPGDDADQIFFKFQKWFKPVLPSAVWANKLGSKYIKLLVVRHPFERLVSAYVDKVRTTRPFLPSVKQMYKNGFVGKGPNGTFTFGEFVNYILELPADKWDNHWAPFTPRCRPCSMRYNVIARVETLDRDLEAFLPRIGLSGWSLPKRNVKAQKNGSLTREIPQYFSEVSRQQMLRLHAIYMYDFELFGYRLEGYTDPVL